MLLSIFLNKEILREVLKKQLDERHHFDYYHSRLRVCSVLNMPPDHFFRQSKSYFHKKLIEHFYPIGVEGIATSSDHHLFPAVPISLVQLAKLLLALSFRGLRAIAAVNSLTASLSCPFLL